MTHWQDVVTDNFLSMASRLTREDRVALAERVRATLLGIEIDPDAGPIEGNRA
jgi:hypothetical protein